MLNATCDLPHGLQQELEPDSKSPPKPNWCEQRAAKELMAAAGMKYVSTYRHPGAQHSTDRYKSGVCQLVGEVVRYDDGGGYFKMIHHRMECWGFTDEFQTPMLLQHARAFIATATAIEAARAATTSNERNH